MGPPNKVQEKNLKVDRPRALGYTGTNKGEINEVRKTQKEINPMV